ncbi:MAG: hypothetical protein IKC05_08075 [Lentisphaeria bacterium]|nr:hypothetical protein [Lentisphaeria bacterium]
MIKRLLFACLTLLFFISVPCESFAAPRKESRKERRERKKKRKNRNEKRPIKKKITPTLEEKLSPAQVTRKIQTIRKRIETAPENIISNKDKPFLLEVFDDMANTQMGRYIFEKAHPDLNFRVKQMGHATNGSYGDGSRCLNLASGIFEQIRNAKTPDEKLSKQLYLAHVIAHEATHSIQHVNNLNDRRNMSFEETIVINKVFELNSILNQNVVRYQVANLPKYRASAESGKLQIVPMHRFYKDLFDAYKTTGLTDDRAHRAARTTFVETFWQNNGATPLQIGGKNITPCDEVIQNWQASYNFIGFGRLVGNNTPYREAMRDRGIDANLRRFTNAMQIDTPTSFFKEKKAFHLPTSRRLVAYANGIRDSEIDALRAGTITKGYKNGKMYFIIINTSHPQLASEDRSYTDYHEGTNVRKSTYTYKNGKMNGIYREYDRQGRQIMEVPVKDDSVKGDGWILEDDKRVLKTFYADNYFKNR